MANHSITIFKAIRGRLVGTQQIAITVGILGMLICIYIKVPYINIYDISDVLRQLRLQLHKGCHFLSTG